MKLSKLTLLAVLIPGIVLGHSWIACTKYDGDIFQDGRYDAGKCRGFTRNFPNDNRGAAFGAQDGLAQSHDFRGGRQPNGPVCKASQAYQYPGGFPSATYRQGERVTLIWPSKNHGGPNNGRGCTDNHPDRMDFVFAYCGNQRRDPAFNELNFGNSPNRIADLKANGRGFKNCLDLCSNTDRAACQGSFTVPNSLSGRCTFVWLWELNQGEFYTTCWEADVQGGAAAPAPAGPAPTPAPAAGRFIRLNRAPNPIPVNGQFDVEVQWNLGTPGDRTLIVDLMRANFEWFGNGVQNQNAAANTNRVQVTLTRQFNDNEEVLLKMSLVNRATFERDPANAWRFVDIDNTVRVRASFSGRRTLDIDDPISLASEISKDVAIVASAVVGVLCVAIVGLAAFITIRAKRMAALGTSVNVEMINDGAAI